MRGNTTLLQPASPVFTGPALFADGTVGAPSIAFSNQSSAGLFWNGVTNSFGAVVNGAEIMRFGNAGGMTITGVNAAYAIGASIGSPDMLLVRDAANTGAIKGTGATPQFWRVYGDATATTLKYLQLTHNGTNAIITTSGGNIGFGTFTSSAGVVSGNTDGVGGYITIVDSGGTTRKLAVVT